MNITVVDRAGQKSTLRAIALNQTLHEEIERCQCTLINIFEVGCRYIEGVHTNKPEHLHEHPPTCIAELPQMVTLPRGSVRVPASMTL
jgi:hypothetical protein